MPEYCTEMLQGINAQQLGSPPWRAVEREPEGANEMQETVIMPQVAASPAAATAAAPTVGADVEEELASTGYGTNGPSMDELETQQYSWPGKSGESPDASPVASPQAESPQTAPVEYL